MWFARLFGGRDEETGYEEATAVAPLPVQPQAAPAPVNVQRPVASKPVATLSAKDRRVDPKRKGFDPYNSGSFERRNAWERVGRR